MAFPQLRELKKAYGMHGFEIIGIAVDEKATLEKYFEKKGELPWLNILDSDSAISDRLKIEAFPTYLLIDQHGKHFATPWDASEVSALVAEKLGIDPIELPKKGTKK